MIRNSNVGLDHLRGLFAKQSIATMDQLKKTVGTVADLTVYRKLRELDYCASYSHRGRFYTLRELAEFDENGLWWIRSIGFSTRGTLVATAEGLVDASEAGYAVEELDAIVRVGTKDVLPKLVREKRLRRTRIGNRNVYFSHKRSVRSHSHRWPDTDISRTPARAPIFSLGPVSTEEPCVNLHHVLELVDVVACLTGRAKSSSAIFSVVLRVHRRPLTGSPAVSYFMSSSILAMTSGVFFR